jgi:hypothetical protein
MSNFLSQVTQTANPQTGSRIVIAGVEGVGKTSLVVGAPKPLLVPLEIGFIPKPIPKTPMLKSFDEVMSFLDEVIATAQKGKFPQKSILFDSATALERLIHEKVVRMDPQYSPGNKKTVTMDSALGGYGKAYDFSNGLFAQFLEKCDLLVEHGGINIIMTCHVFADKVIDPSAGEYNTWNLLLHSPKNQKTYGKREMLTQWSDLVGFLHEPIFVSKNSENFVQGISANKGRILGLERTPGYVAKNRFNICGEIAIPKEQSWNYLADVIYKCSGRDLYNRELT